LEELQASRVRVVEAGDHERRRLERDLHDGAQQRLVSLAIAVGMLRGRAVSQSTGLVAALDEAQSELQAAIDDLRELAHGIYPVVLAEEGLAAGVEALVEGAKIPMVVETMPQERFDQPIEVAAYFLIVGALRAADARRATVGARRAHGSLVVDLEHDGRLTDALTEIEDRISVLNGSLSVAHHDNHVRIHAEIPCAS
jgi:signal transduction histidine kinase